MVAHWLLPGTVEGLPTRSYDSLKPFFCMLPSVWKRTYTRLDVLVFDAGKPPGKRDQCAVCRPLPQNLPRESLCSVGPSKNSKKSYWQVAWNSISNVSCSKFNWMSWKKPDEDTTPDSENGTQLPSVCPTWWTSGSQDGTGITMSCWSDLDQPHKKLLKTLELKNLFCWEMWVLRANKNCGLCQGKCKKGEVNKGIFTSFCPTDRRK